VPRGGRRPGSGRPSNAQREEKAQLQARQTAKFNEACLYDLPEFYETAKQLALGLWVEELDEAGARLRVYQKPPDKQVLLNLMEHAKGRPTTAQIGNPDTEIKIYHSIPRAPKPKGGANASLERADDGSDTGSALP